MQPPELPDNEPARFQTLVASGLLFSPEEQRFDRITRLAQHLFGVEIVLISLVADDFQWFKSRQGLDVARTDRSVSICGHAILQEKVFVVEDAAQDTRFHDNPLVTGAPHIRFYAGAPLHLSDDRADEEHKIGTLCLIDSKPGTLSPHRQQLLRDLADLVELELRQAHLEEQLTRAELAEQRLRGLFELAPYGIALNDFESGAFIDMNQALLAPTGYTREEFAGLSYWQVTPEKYAAQEEQQLLSMQETGRYGPYEKEYIRKDGTRYPVLLNGMVMDDDRGHKVIWSIIEDVSERKRMQRLKDEFVSTVSHELRTPLTALRGALGLLSAGTLGPLPDAAGEMVAVAENNSQRLLLLINDLLDMEKLAAGKMGFDLEWHALAGLVQTALQEYQPYANPYGVRLSYVDHAGDVLVKVDAARAQQIMANLLSNAIKYSPAGGEVQVISELQGEAVRITVADNGPGIPEEFSHRIFQKFSQADSSDARRLGGTGLGLAITRELVENMGGTIDFRSRPGEGSRFFIELPTRRAPRSCAGR